MGVTGRQTGAGSGQSYCSMWLCEKCRLGSTFPQLRGGTAAKVTGSKALRTEGWGRGPPALCMPGPGLRGTKGDQESSHSEVPGASTQAFPATAKQCATQWCQPDTSYPGSTLWMSRFGRQPPCQAPWVFCTWILHQGKTTLKPKPCVSRALRPASCPTSSDGDCLPR